MPSYRSLMAQPSWRRLFIASSASRLPITMGVLGLVLAGRHLGSFALGARLAAIYTITGALSSVWRGRRMDRGDLRDGLRRDGAVVAVVAAAMAVTLRAHGPTIIVAALAVALGLALAAIPGGYRAMLSSIIPESEVHAAYALDAVCVEVCFVTGPAVAATAAWFAGPAGVFAVIAVCALGGSLATLRLPSVPRTAPGGSHGRAPYRITTMQGVLAGTLAAGMALGVLDVTLPALAVALGTRAAFGGVFVTLMSLGSGVGGLVLGPRVATGDGIARRAAILLLLFGVMVLPIAASSNVGVVLVMTFVAGAPFALMATSASVLIQRSIHQARTTEAFSLLNAGLLAGAAAGSALASTLLGSVGARATLLLAGAGPVLAACTLLAVTGSSRPSSPHVEALG
jgi:MFS family permease